MLLETFAGLALSFELPLQKHYEPMTSVTGSIGKKYDVHAKEFNFGNMVPPSYKTEEVFPSVPSHFSIKIVWVAWQPFVSVPQTSIFCGS